MTDLQTKPQLTTIEVRNPADGTVVGAVPNDSAETVGATAADLRRCQPEWEAMGPKGRRPWLMKFQEWMWYPYSRRKGRLAMGIMRAAAAHGRRRFGFTRKGGAR
jgi:acyl-CoA reductase-like NAD-dependent aldehyde dehydrogenase